ncbi:hypothetical protein MTO96_006891 [Rhipicephalus appendiculatus]
MYPPFPRNPQRPSARTVRGSYICFRALSTRRINQSSPRALFLGGREQPATTTGLIPSDGSLNLKNQYNYSHFGGIDPLERAKDFLQAGGSLPVSSQSRFRHIARALSPRRPGRTWRFCSAVWAPSRGKREVRGKSGCVGGRTASTAATNPRARPRAATIQLRRAAVHARLW